MIKVYSKFGCSDCEKTKQFLKQWGIPFKELSATANAEMLKADGFRQLPVVVTQDDKWSGHNISKLMQLVGRDVANE